MHDAVDVAYNDTFLEIVISKGMKGNIFSINWILHFQRLLGDSECASVFSCFMFPFPLHGTGNF